MLNKEGKTVTSKEEIKTVFENFYTELFKTNNEGNDVTRELDEIIFNTIQMIDNNSNITNNEEIEITLR